LTPVLVGMAPNPRWAVPALAGGAVAAWLVSFPVQPVMLGLGLLLASALVAWRPHLLFTLVAAALPLLDLAPWSGRTYLDEFDALLLLGTAVAWARLPPALPARRQPSALNWAFTLLLVSLLIGLVRALSPWPGLPLDAFSQPMSPFNALRLGKSALWALCLWRLATRLQTAGADVVNSFGLGLVLGLAGTVAAVVAERLAFSYLLEFAGSYRVAGPISAMSLGGAYIECFIAVATPFLLAQWVRPGALWRSLACTGLLISTAYALMVTFSRGGYAAMALAVLVFAGANLMAKQRRRRSLALGLASSILVAGVAYPVLSGSFAQSRLQTLAADLGTREKHWADVLQMMGSDPVSIALGIGLGRFAEVKLWHTPVAERPGSHRLVPVDGARQALRLGAGHAYFVDQIVALQPGASYSLKYRLRTADARAALSVALCQKWLLSSAECSAGQPVQTAAATAATAPGCSPQDCPKTTAWQEFSLRIVAPEAGPGRLPRPVRLSLNNAGRVPVDLSWVSLVGADGVEKVRNGDFQAGMDGWTATSDNHLSWHTKSLLLGVYVELGLFGVSALLALLLAGAWRAASAAAQGQADGAALLAAMAAFGTVGLIDTLVDAPRFMLLCLLLCLLPGALARR
jgi:O-antigen ligase